MYIEAQYNEYTLKGTEEQFKTALHAEYPDAEILVYHDAAPSIVIFDVDDEDEKEKIKFRIIDIRNSFK